MDGNKYTVYNRIERSRVIKINNVSVSTNTDSKTPIKITLKKLSGGRFLAEKAMLMCRNKFMRKHVL